MGDAERIRQLEGEVERLTRELADFHKAWNEPSGEVKVLQAELLRLMKERDKAEAVVQAAETVYALLTTGNIEEPADDVRIDSITALGVLMAAYRGRA